MEEIISIREKKKKKSPAGISISDSDVIPLTPTVQQKIRKHKGNKTLPKTLVDFEDLFFKRW